MSLHHKNLQAAIRSNEPLYCPAELGLHGVVAARMANLSFYKRKMVEWDAERQHVIASKEGIWECTYIGECSVVCPKHVDPASDKIQAKFLLNPWSTSPLCGILSLT